MFRVWEKTRGSRLGPQTEMARDVGKCCDSAVVGFGVWGLMTTHSGT